MFGKHPISDCLFKSLLFLQILSRSVEANWTNNHTLIKIINNMQSTWTAGENTMHITQTYSTAPSKKLKKSTVPTLQTKSGRTPPSFDARKHWRGCCRVVGRVRDQGMCGSCWAVSAVSVLSDRICIATNASVRVHLSAEDVITCCAACHASQAESSRSSNCESGAYVSDAFYYWMQEGIVTGGEVGSKQGCKPYSQDSYSRKNVPCRKHCSNKEHWKEYEEDKFTGNITYHVEPNEQAIKNEIFTHGPVVASFLMYPDLQQYKTGVYRHLVEEKSSAHALKVIGWGQEDGTKYWLAVNSWGEGWGMNGYVKFLRGENHCSFEEYVTAARMVDGLSVGETLRNVDANSQNKVELCSVKQLVLSVFVTWVVKVM